MRAINPKGFVLALLAAAFLIPGTASAFSVSDFDTVTDPNSALFFSFDVVGPGNSSAADLAQLDFGLAVTNDGSDVVFELINLSSISSVITLVYFDDSGESLIGNGSVLSTQVNGQLKFNVGGGSPGDLPGGNTIGFSANSDLTVYATNPKPSNGIGAGERLVLGYDAVADLADIGNALLDGTLRVGLHVQSIGTAGDSDAFVSEQYLPPPTPNTPVPEPATLVLLGMGASFLAARKRFQA